MPSPDFVLMYHPALGNARALVSHSSIDDHAAKGWLLVSGTTPTPTAKFLTPELADARYARTGDIDDPATPTGAALRAASVAAVKAAAEDGEIELGGTPDLTGYQTTRLATPRAVAQSPVETGMRFQRVGHTGQPFMGATAQTMAAGKAGSPSVYWPCLIHARSTIGASALDEWYLLHTTDHASGEGGVWLSTAPDWRGPWTGRGRVYADTTSGSQTETASAVWLPEENQFGLLYQQQFPAGAVGVQATCVAFSPTLLPGSFTRHGVAIDIPDGGAMPGNGHTGYASVHSDGGIFYSHHLMGGTNPSLAGISQSVDFRTWWTDQRPLMWATDQIDGTLRLPWGGVQVVRWRGVLWVLGTLTNGAAGTDPRVSKIFSARLAEDRRHIIGRPTYHLAPMGQETVNLRSLNATVTPDGELVLIYQTDQNFFLAAAV